MDDILEEVVEWFAPQVAGCRSAKEALILMLVGGRQGNATYRHDINLLLVDGVGGVRRGLCAAAAEISPLGVHPQVPGASAGDGVLYLDEFRRMSAGEKGAVFGLLDTRSVMVGRLGMSYVTEVRGPLLAVGHGEIGGWNGMLSLVRRAAVGMNLLTRFDLACVLEGDVWQDGGGGRLSDEYAGRIRAARLLRPGIAEAAKEELTEWYVEARQRRNVRVNPRHPVTVLRLAYAHAKLCAHGDVGVDSMQLAIRMVEEMAPALTRDVPPHVVLGTGAR